MSKGLRFISFAILLVVAIFVTSVNVMAAGNGIIALNDIHFEMALPILALALATYGSAKKAN